MKGFITKRIYEKSAENDGYRVLVDRIWPRGVSKEKANLDDWKKELAPSNELRKWFDHKVERYEEFREKYRKELESHKEELEEIRKIAKEQQVCILYGAKDEEHNQAVVLKEILELKSFK